MSNDKQCSVDGCGKPAFSGGLCNMHMLRLRRHGSTDKPTKRKTRSDVIDMRGQRFGRYVVVDFVPTKSSARWLCACDCGSKRVVKRSALISGGVQSCGCKRAEQTSKRLTRHGMFGTPVYAAWSAMLKRCTNKNDKHFKDYGGRGISVCDAWRSFDAFFADMGDKPAGLSLDRVNNNLGYSKENCRWASLEEQNSNRRGCIRVNVNGSYVSPKDAAALLQKSVNVIYSLVKTGSVDYYRL